MKIIFLYAPNPVSTKYLKFDYPISSAAYAYYLLHYLEDENNVEEEAAHDVRACVQAFRCDLLSVLLHILDARKAAVVIVVVPMQRPSISAKGKRESFRILRKHCWTQRGSLRRHGVRDFTMLVDLPG